MNNNNTITLKNEKIDLSDWLTTIQKNEKENTSLVSIEINDYLEIGYYISSLINVSRVAIENGIFEADKLEISRVLELANNLIPFTELELLDKLRK